MSSTFQFGGKSVDRGTRTVVKLPLPALPNGASIELPVAIVNGKKPGPTIWISAAIHGDEILGTQIIRRLLALIDPREFTGTLLAVPVVDVYGFNRGSRYLSDRRDLNRSFPGTRGGSLATQLAYVFLHHVVRRCELGIDLHTGSGGRINHPQIRGVVSDSEFMNLAHAFAAPLIVDSSPIDGSLRKACGEIGIEYILFEAGEANRFDNGAIEIGVAGCQRVLADHGLLKNAPSPKESATTIASARWLRAPRSGLFVRAVELGQVLAKGATAGTISGTFGDDPIDLVVPNDGIVVGIALEPLVESGDALVHLGFVKN